MAGIHYPLEGVAYCEPSVARHYFQVGAWEEERSARRSRRRHNAFPTSWP